MKSYEISTFRSRNSFGTWSKIYILLELYDDEFTIIVIIKSSVTKHHITLIYFNTDILHKKRLGPHLEWPRHPDDSVSNPELILRCVIISPVGPWQILPAQVTKATVI